MSVGPLLVQYKFYCSIAENHPFGRYLQNKKGRGAGTIQVLVVARNRIGSRVDPLTLFFASETTNRYKVQSPSTAS